MITTYRRQVVASLVLIAGCSGGGDSVVFPSGPPWFKFRQNVSNTALGSSNVANTAAAIAWTVQVDESAPFPIVASPAVAVDGSIYAGSTGGTLAAITPSGTVRWRATTCDVCPGTLATQPFDAFISSPMVFSMNQSTTVYTATGDGRVLALADAGNAAVCTACFSALAHDDSLASASFESSPTLTTHPIVGNVTAVFIGATVRRRDDAVDRGKIYALNSGGTLQWEFPSRVTDQGEIGPVTSSPALGPGNNVYATTADGDLVALTSGGLEIWRFQVGSPRPTAAAPLLAPSAVTTSSRVFAASADGRIVGLTLNGQFTWAHESEDELATSLAFGFQSVSTPTPTSTNGASATPTPTPAITATPTRTPTSGIAPATLYGISKRGILVVLNATLGSSVPPSGPLPTPITGEVESSPAVSLDSYLVFGTNAGLLYIINSATGLPSSGFPLQLTNGAAIRSSPSIGSDGTIYVGADNGMLYAVGAP